MNAMINTEVAVNKVGIIKTPNQPMYKRFSVLVIHSQKRAHRLVLSRLSKIAVIIKLKIKKIFTQNRKKTGKTEIGFFKLDHFQFFCYRFGIKNNT